jgi:hypothetical protein
VKRGYMIATRAVLAALMVTYGSACTNDISAGTGAPERYRYNAEQRSPFAAVQSGVLTVTQQAGDRFDGTLDVLQTNPNGQLERRAGIVRGRWNAGTMDFDVMLEGDVYRHVGRSLADTVAGSWIDVSAVGNAASGTFRLERAP